VTMVEHNGRGVGRKQRDPLLSPIISTLGTYYPDNKHDPSMGKVLMIRRRQWDEPRFRLAAMILCR
jgi:hypothetical protein